MYLYKFECADIIICVAATCYPTAKRHADIKKLDMGYKVSKVKCISTTKIKSGEIVSVEKKVRI